MKQEIKFSACAYLDFSEKYTAHKEPISTPDGVKLCWFRPVPDSSYPALVQFCEKRGRLNSPECCLSEPNKMCSDYTDFEHSTTFEDNQ